VLVENNGIREFRTKAPWTKSPRIKSPPDKNPPGQKPLLFSVGQNPLQT